MQMFLSYLISYRIRSVGVEFDKWLSYLVSTNICLGIEYTLPSLAAMLTSFHTSFLRSHGRSRQLTTHQVLPRAHTASFGHLFDVLTEVEVHVPSGTDVKGQRPPPQPVMRNNQCNLQNRPVLRLRKLSVTFNLPLSNGTGRNVYSHIDPDRSKLFAQQRQVLDVI